MSAAFALAVILFAVLAQVASAAPGDISTIAGGGTGNPSGGGPATGVGLFSPRGVVATPDGGFLIADTNHNRVEKVSSSGILTVVAGTGNPDCSGDGGAANASGVYIPQGVAPTSDGGFLIADTGNNRIRKVSSAGIISTVAGDVGCTSGSSGDGGPATAAKLAGPTGVAPIPGGGFLIADVNNQRIREVSAGGTISTVAGNGTPGYSGNGGAATLAQLQNPFGVAATASGGFLIADSYNRVIRKVSAGGTISTVAGNGTAGSSGYDGDGGPATAAAVPLPFAVSSTADGGFLIADINNSRIRKVEGTPLGGIPPPPPPPSNNFTIVSRITCAGVCHVILVKITFDSAGNVIAQQALPNQLLARGAVVKKKPTLLIKKLRQAVRAGKNTLRLKLTAAAIKTLKKKGRLRIRVRFTFTPTGGTAKSKVKAFTVKLPQKKR